MKLSFGTSMTSPDGYLDNAAQFLESSEVKDLRDLLHGFVVDDHALSVSLVALIHPHLHMREWHSPLIKMEVENPLSPEAFYRARGEAAFLIEYLSPEQQPAENNGGEMWMERLLFGVENPRAFDHYKIGVLDLEMVKKAVAEGIDPEIMVELSDLKSYYHSLRLS